MKFAPEVLLEIGEPDGGTRSIRIVGLRLTIGREDCDLTLGDSRVSRIHAVLAFDASGSLRLFDLGSSNGTHYRGERIATAVIELGGGFQVGDTRIRVLHVRHFLPLESLRAAIENGVTG